LQVNNLRGLFFWRYNIGTTNDHFALVFVDLMAEKSTPEPEKIILFENLALR